MELFQSCRGITRITTRLKRVGSGRIVRRPTKLGKTRVRSTGVVTQGVNQNAAIAELHQSFVLQFMQAGVDVRTRTSYQ
ncbi:MAG: hypothetical protein RLZZ371_733 [Pseudomonadota bacterium]